MIRLPLGVRQLSALEIYVCDPALECCSCELDNATLVIHDLQQAWSDVVDGANSADDDVQRGLGTGDLREAMCSVSHRLSKLLATVTPCVHGRTPSDCEFCVNSLRAE